MGTTSWAILRSARSVDMQGWFQGRKEQEQSVNKKVLAVLLTAIALCVLSGVGRAEPIAPNWMPSSPIHAGNQVILLWLPTPNAAKYHIYMNGAKIGESQMVQHMLPAPSEAGEYKYEITSVDASGAESKKSAPGVIRIIKLEPPGAIYARASESAVQLRWDAAKGAIIYNVYRADKQGADPTLLGSVQSEGYTDTTLAKGKTYFYSVSAKDLGGKESARSKPAQASLLVPVKVDAAVKVDQKIVSTKEGETSRLAGENKVQLPQSMEIGPDGFIYLVDAKVNHVLKIDRSSLSVVGKIGCGPDGPCQSRLFNDLALTEDGLVYVNDPWAKKVFVFDTEGKFRSEFPIPEVKAKEVLDPLPEEVRKKGQLTNGIAIDRREKVVYIVDERFNTVYKFGMTGEFLGHLGHGGPNPAKDLTGPGRIVVSPAGELYISQPLTHVIHVMDPKSGLVVRTIGKRATGYVGGFIGITGMSFDPKGNLVVSDSGVHSIQVFDGKSGDYLYHLGDETGKPDTEMPDRASLAGIRFPVGAFVRDGNLYIFRGDKNQITTRQVVAN